MSDDQFQRITKRFDQIDGRFEKVDKQIGELSNLLSQLYQHTEGGFASLHDELSRKADKEQVDRMFGLIDQQIKQQEVDEHERLAMNHQLDRHEHWIVRAAKRLGLGYER